MYYLTSLERVFLWPSMLWLGWQAGQKKKGIWEEGGSEIERSPAIELSAEESKD